MSHQLPVSRIKTIMESSAEVETISKESLHLVTLATELFIKHLAEKVAVEANGNEISYKHVAEVVNTNEKYDFLTEIIPRKITVRHFKEMMRKKNAPLSESDSESSLTDTDSSENSTTHSEDDAETDN